MQQIESVNDLQKEEWYHLYNAKTGEYRGSHQLKGGNTEVPFCYFCVDGTVWLWAEKHNDQVTDKFIIFGPIPHQMLTATGLKELIDFQNAYRHQGGEVDT